MMRLPNGEVIMHGDVPYDPAKAHDYYMRTRQLKGRRPGQGTPLPSGGSVTRQKAANRARAKHEIAARIQGLEIKLQNLEALIKKKEAVLKRDQKINKKPTAADKRKAAKESKKYRQQNRSELAAKAKAAAEKAGGGKGNGGPGTPGKAGAGQPDSQKPIKELKMLATKVRGQLQAAKTKLSAL